MKHLLYAAQVIQDAGLATIGVDLFIGTIPPDVTEGVMLRNALDPALADDAMPDYYHTQFQVIVRSADSLAGYDRAASIGKALRCDHVNTPDLHVCYMRPESLPITYPRGVSDDLETALRMLIAFGEKMP